MNIFEQTEQTDTDHPIPALFDLGIEPTDDVNDKPILRWTYFIKFEDQNPDVINYIKMAALNHQLERIGFHPSGTIEILYLGDDYLLRTILQNLHIVDSQEEHSSIKYLESDINFVTLCGSQYTKPIAYKIFKGDADINGWEIEVYKTGYLIHTKIFKDVKVPDVVFKYIPLVKGDRSLVNIASPNSLSLQCRHSYQIIQISIFVILRQCKFCGHEKRDPYVEYQRPSET